MTPAEEWYVVSEYHYPAVARSGNRYVLSPDVTMRDESSYNMTYASELTDAPPGWPTRKEAEAVGKHAHERVVSRDDLLALITMARAQHAMEGT